MTVWSKPQAFPDLNGVAGLLLRQKQVIYMGLVVSSEGLKVIQARQGPLTTSQPPQTSKVSRDFL